MTNALVPWRPQLNSVYHMDVRLLLAALETGSVDLQICDPPYGMGYRAGTQVTYGGRKRKFSAATFEDTLQTDWLKDSYRVMKDGGAMYLFTQWQVEPIWRDALSSAGYDVKMALYWNKCHWGQGDLSIYGSQTEMILFATKGRHKLRGKRTGSLRRRL